MWEKLVADFYQNFIEDNRWKYITDGLQNTLKITFLPFSSESCWDFWLQLSVLLTRTLTG